MSNKNCFLYVRVLPNAKLQISVDKGFHKSISFSLSLLFDVICFEINQQLWKNIKESHKATLLLRHHAARRKRIHTSQYPKCHTTSPHKRLVNSIYHYCRSPCGSGAHMITQICQNLTPNSIIQTEFDHLPTPILTMNERLIQANVLHWQTQPTNSPKMRLLSRGESKIKTNLSGYNVHFQDLSSGLPLMP